MPRLLNFLTENPFIPHGHCYLWKPGLVGLHIISDSLIALAYYSIPLTLLYFVRKREDLPFNGIFLLFVAFILACGTTHIMEVWTLWHPHYWISGFLKAITATVSAYTAVKLVPLVPLALALPSPAQLEAANVELKREIATRKLVEEELRKSEERFRSAFDNAATGLALADLDGSWFKVNRSFCNLVGYSEEELLGMSFQTITHPDDVDTSLKNIRLLLNGELNYYHLEKRYIHKDGHIVWIVLSKSIMRETFNSEDANQHLGKPLYLIDQLQDITERKIAEEELKKSSAALRDSEAEMRALFAAMSDVILVLDRQGRYLKIAPTNPSLLYQPPEELIGKTLAQVFLPEIAKFFKTYIDKALNLKVPVNIEYSLPIDNKIVWFAACISPMTDDTVIWVARDITESKQAEAALIQAKDQLEIRVQERTAELQNAVYQLERSQEELHQSLEKEKELSELKSRFITMASHEFRTPLATILSSSDLLKSFGHKFSEERKLQHLNKIQTQVKNMTLLLEDVLFMGKVEAGKLTLNVTSFNLEVFCRELIDEISLADRRKHKLLFESHGDCSTVEMDCQLLRQILTNLVSNAFKYSPEGAIIQVTIICNNERTIINVQDQGIGIPICEQHHIFEIFHRASNVGNISGTGLGLAIVKQAVELHQGKISFESEVGVGTSFTVSMPTHQLKMYLHSR
ncbi:MAG TPA: PAS domain S-box protein [Oculatellaceae cyanobacterium]|jgi:PAS domain S-box-containing protein